MINPQKCIIIDDEPLAIEVIESYVERFDYLSLLKTFTNPVKAFEFLGKNPVDLIFMDIQMPQLTGLDLVKSLINKPKIIFTTAYRDYALEGFELEVTDYLLKPISFDRFVKAITKATSEDAEQATSGKYLFLKVDKKMVKVELEKIRYLESQRDYVKFVTDEKSFCTHMSITEAEHVLPSTQFFRVHRSFIVPKNRIDAYNSSEIEIGSDHIPVGRNYRPEVLKILNTLADKS
ncbi:MAG: response regulator transcription factor [Cyclobacteriaceae bacterium]|nr:response regulator transcription factor [Cyclobacteriaceae bacterium HetDA_MAG_MS6]